MAAERSERNVMEYVARNAWDAPRDEPDALKHRYFTDGRGGGRAFYVDPTIRRPAFRELYGTLRTSGFDIEVVRDMVAIATHRQWSIVALEGSYDFRREAWLRLSLEGVTVEGYRVSERDQQDLDRRLEQRRTLDRTSTSARSPLKTLEAAIRSRVVDPGGQTRLLQLARARIAGWLDRGGRFEAVDHRTSPPPNRERAHGR